jgi:hypothetical protein
MSDTAPLKEPPKQFSPKTVRALLLTALFIMVFGLILAAIPVSKMIGKQTLSSRSTAAKLQLGMIAIALARYEADFRALPPVDPSLGGTHLEKFLCARIQNQSTFYGPYLILPSGKFASPLGAAYFYVVRLDATGKPEALIIDPGLDGLLGGKIDANGHFVPDGGDADKDGVPDDQDNLYSLPNP